MRKASSTCEGESAPSSEHDDTQSTAAIECVLSGMSDDEDDEEEPDTPRNSVVAAATFVPVAKMPVANSASVAVAPRKGGSLPFLPYW